jgi:hypothetical protein
MAHFLEDVCGTLGERLRRSPHLSVDAFVRPPRAELGAAIGGGGRGEGEEATGSDDSMLADRGAGNASRGGAGDKRKKRRRWMRVPHPNRKTPLIHVLRGSRWG